jgi:hypothetical protein
MGHMETDTIFVGKYCAALPVQVFAHTDCFAFFVIKFAVQEKAVFFIKGTDPFVMFKIRVHSEETAGAIIIVTLTGDGTGLKAVLPTVLLNFTEICLFEEFHD